MKTLSIRYLRAAVCAAALMGASLSFAQLTLTNSPAWDGTDAISPFGHPNTATYGQTFTTDAVNTFMNSFRFHLGTRPTINITFRGYVAAWDGAKITGPILFSTGNQTLTPGPVAFLPITINTGSLSLAASTQYVAFLSTSEVHALGTDTTIWGYTPADTYSGGQFVFDNNGSNFAALSTSAWDDFLGGNLDLAFTVEFSRDEHGGHVVPEPSTYGLIGAMALLGLVAVRRMRRS